MVDAPPVDATPRGLITVTVYGDGVDRNPGVPVPGAYVYFVEPDNTVTEITTGLDGIATALEPDNTTVWIIHRASSTDYFIETYEGVQIGDSIIGGDPTPPGSNTFAGTAYVAHPSFGNATLYNMVLSCTPGPTASSASPIAQNFLACPQEMTANAVVWATDSQGNLGYTTATGVDLTAHTSPGTALALPAFQPGATVGVTFTNLPSSMGESSADLRARYTSGADPAFLQDIELHEGTLTDTMTASGAIAPFGDHTQVIGLVSVGANAYTYNYNATNAALLSNVTIDASAMVHPAKAWQYNSATSSITWLEEAFGVDPTVVESSLSWNTGVSVVWHLTAPYSGGPSLALPAFPSDLSSLMSSPSDAAFKQVDLTTYAGKVYHDVLIRQVAGAPSWRIGVGP
jgi:hypothetical protein